jgi:nicotinate-nucleotide pyrophosphorylase (carboxylating)
VLPSLIQIYDPSIELEAYCKDGDRVKLSGDIARLSGPYPSILALERTSLNLLTHLSGIATLTARYVKEVKGTKAQICCTRKTHLGLRGLEKYAVHCGGATSHRMGLYDAVLWKDNHLAHFSSSLEELEKGIREAAEQARKRYPKLKFIQVEVDSLEQLEYVLRCPVDMVLLDNMSCASLEKAVWMRNETAPRILLEASGGVYLPTLSAVAKTGVDRISVGALTHSAPALDIGLDLLD